MGIQVGFAQTAALKRFLCNLCLSLLCSGMSSSLRCCAHIGFCSLCLLFFSFFRRFALMGGTPKGSRGRPGTAFGQAVLNDAICGHFWSHFWTPFGTLGVKVATPGAPLAPPLAPLAPFLRPFLQSVLHGCYFGCPGCRAGAPRAWKCGQNLVNTDVLRRCTFGAQGAKKASPGAPGRVFGTFWSPFGPPWRPFRPP